MIIDWLKYFLVIGLTVVIALILAILPLPSSIHLLKPNWMAMLTIYWGMTLPKNFGMGYAWCMGLLLDSLQGTFLGEHALALVVIAYLVARAHRRLSLYPVWQQAIMVMILLEIYQLLVYWPQGLFSVKLSSHLYWLAPVLSMVLWPWFFYSLRSIQRYFRLQ